MTRCFTFYSYKGGSGRSTTAVNTVRHLVDTLGANPQKPILLVDADLESAGLTYFFRCEEKFSGLFSSSVHISGIIENASVALSNTSSKVICGNGDFGVKRLIVSNSRVVDNIAKGKIFSARYPVREYLEGMRLNDYEMECFERIVEACCNPDYQASNTEAIVSQYKVPLTNLAGSIQMIHCREDLSDSEKVAQKMKCLHAFLPATRFVDISEFFGCAEGTVRFLGVDVRMAHQIFDANTAFQALNKLRRECQNTHNYAAVIFDSGAGTQSSAEAFHDVSDVIIYCMRPTRQFRRGTRLQIINHEAKLKDMRSLYRNRKYAESYRPVVLLPTAVPDISSEQTSPMVRELCKTAFLEIQAMIDDYSELVNGDFCTPETALPEVEMFKWEEKILVNRAEIAKEADQLKAYDVYRKLAEGLTEMTRITGEKA